MPINQFAKISPIVNAQGYLLEKDEKGIYSIVSPVRLKENEIGICIDDKSFITTFNGIGIKINGGIFENSLEALEYANKNTNGDYNGQLITIKSNPGKLYVLVGTELYSLIDNTTRSIIVDIPNNYSNGIHFKVENLIAREDYIINSIDITMGDNKFYDKNSSIISNPAITIMPELAGNFTDINITEDFYNQQTRCIINEKMKGDLYIQIYDSSMGGQAYSYDGKTISLVITYTPIS